jgi:hypothetical protein
MCVSLPDPFQLGNPAFEALPAEGQAFPKFDYRQWDGLAHATARASQFIELLFGEAEKFGRLGQR